MGNVKKSVVCAGTVMFRFNNKNLELFFIKPKVRNNNKKYKNHEEWGFPKGHLEIDEIPQEAAIRETFEESGIIPKLLYELQPVFTSNPKENKTVHFWLSVPIKSDNKNLKNNDEVEEMGWFGINNLPGVHEYQRPVLKSALSILLKNLKKFDI